MACARHDVESYQDPSLRESSRPRSSVSSFAKRTYSYSHGCPTAGAVDLVQVRGRTSALDSGHVRLVVAIAGGRSQTVQPVNLVSV